MDRGFKYTCVRGIQAAAVADAVRALITAGLVEETAAYEAVSLGLLRS